MLHTQPDELDSFRNEWLNEVSQRTQSSTTQPRTQPDSQSSSLPDAHPETQPHALAIYASAAYYERIGLLDEATAHYRKAFRLEPEIDRIYQNLKPDQLALLERRADNPIHPPINFQASFNHTDNYTAPPIPSGSNTRSNLLSLDRHLQSTSSSSYGHYEDPSSTNQFLHSLLASYRAHPWQRDHPRSEGLDNHEQNPTIDPTTHTIEKDTNNRDIEKINEQLLDLKIEPTDEIVPVSIGLKFEPLDIERPCLLEKMPLELIMKVLSVFARTRSHVHLAISTIESFARVSRFARVLTLEKTLWRSICETIYTHDLFSNKEENQLLDSSTSTVKLDFVHSLCEKLYRLDWRKMFIDQPRIRLEGCYIALVRYPRQGESANPWYTPTHFVTYFRYLRFFEDGRCVSLTSTEEPEIVVRKLNWPTINNNEDVNQRVNSSNTSRGIEGLLFGLWSLEGARVKVYNLHQDSSILSCSRHTNFNFNTNLRPTVPRSSRDNYQFLMDCRLSSTRRGKMNKLEIKRFATINLTNGETEELPLLPKENEQYNSTYCNSNKPLIFSRVISYDLLLH